MEPLWNPENDQLRLSERQIKAIKAPSKRTSLFDGRGLELRISSDGNGSWSLLYRFDNQRLRYTIGLYPAIKLKEARLLADKLRNQIAHGKNPQELKVNARNTNIVTVGECYSLFLERYLKIHLKSWKSYDSAFRSNVLPRLGSKDISKVTKADILYIVDKIKDRDAHILANRVLQYISRFLKWCIGRGYLQVNPAANIPKPSKEVRRERVLSLAEVRLIYKACDYLGLVNSAFVRLLILSGQRRSEISNLAWEELTDNRIELSATRSKNGKPILTPLTHYMKSTLEEIPRNNGRYIFSTTGGEKPIGNFTKIKEKLTKQSGVKDWTYHDFRRSMATTLEECGYDRYTIMFALNHTDTSITAVYDKSSHLTKKKMALEEYQNQILINSDASSQISAK